MRATVVLALAALLAACGVKEEVYKAKELEAQKNMKAYQDEAQKSADLERKLASVQGRLGDLEKQFGVVAGSKEQLEREKGQLVAEKDRLTAEKAVLEKKSAEYERLAGSLKSQIAAGQIEVSELKGKLTVKLKDKILFASGSTAIGREGKGALDNVAEAFKDLKGRSVLVAGYTDDVPTNPKSFPSNWELSTARAIAVVKYLQSKGVDPVMLGAAGFSEYRPVAANETPEGRSQNRRIEIALTPADYTPPAGETRR
ncbi:MAG TPA: OmpA family protein [Anaeromyxobacteraceae bacterium]